MVPKRTFLLLLLCPLPSKHLVLECMNKVWRSRCQVYWTSSSLWLHTPSPAPNPLHIVSLGATDGSGHRTPPTHPSGTLLVGLRVWPHPWIPLANCSLPPMRYILQGWIEQCFLLKAVHLPSRA